MDSKIEIVSERVVRVITLTGQKFEIVCPDAGDHITVTAVSSFGNTLAVRPIGANSVKISEE